MTGVQESKQEQERGSHWRPAVKSRARSGDRHDRRSKHCRLVVKTLACSGDQARTGHSRCRSETAIRNL